MGRQTPEFCEIDTISHDGGFTQDEYAFTLSLTDATTCWSEFRAPGNKARKWTLDALQNILDGFPIPLRGLDSSDNGVSSSSIGTSKHGVKPITSPYINHLWAVLVQLLPGGLAYARSFRRTHSHTRDGPWYAGGNVREC
jgi:hypothetical protein